MKAIVSMAAGAVLAAALGSTALAPRALAQAGGVAEIEGSPALARRLTRRQTASTFLDSSTVERPAVNR